MDKRFIALKLFLDELGIPVAIDTVDDRKKVQKAVYLGQLSGVDLGYRFGWYLMGPYSPALTRDYYGLAEIFHSGDSSYQNHRLNQQVRSTLQRVRPVLQVPEGVSLEQEDWLELVASLHYLQKVRRLTYEEARWTLSEKKSHLIPFVEAAKKALMESSLLPSEE